MKSIRLMPDYQCFPLWNMMPGEYGDFDPRVLPIPKVLRRQIMDWARVYDETLNMEDPVASGFTTVEAKDTFEAEGLWLADRLREELGPGFLVEVKIRAFVKAGPA